VIAWIAAAVAVFYSLWSVALAVLFARHLRIPEDRLSGRVSLVLPATGTLPGLEDLLTALTVQSLPLYRVIAAVEAREDPAYIRLAALARRYPELNIEVVVAGLSPLRSQKCTNLLAALEKLEAEDAYVVLLDADIRPQPWWLAALVGPLAAGRADVVTGYRWPTPTTLSPGTALVAMIDRAIAVLPRLSQTRPIWGGVPRCHASRPGKARSAEYDRTDPDRGSADRRPRRRNRLAGIDPAGDPTGNTARRQFSRSLALRAPAIPADTALPAWPVAIRGVRHHHRSRRAPDFLSSRDLLPGSCRGRAPDCRCFELDRD